MARHYEAIMQNHAPKRLTVLAVLFLALGPVLALLVLVDIAEARVEVDDMDMSP